MEREIATAGRREWVGLGLAPVFTLTTDIVMGTFTLALNVTTWIGAAVIALTGVVCVIVLRGVTPAEHVDPGTTAAEPRVRTAEAESAGRAGYTALRQTGSHHICAGDRRCAYIQQSPIMYARTRRLSCIAPSRCRRC